MGAAAVVVGAAACGLLFVSTSGRAATGGSSQNVKVTERDFSIRAPKRVAAGDISLTVTNAGPDTHELIVVRTTGAPLPLRSDGLTVNEKRVDHRIAGTLEPRGPGTTRTLRLHLAPGRYVLLCNMAGHYLGGMHTQLVVR